MILAKFRDRYPQGSLISKLVQIDRGNFIVKVSIIVENITLVTALAGASDVEAAEDAARARAIAALCLDQQTTSSSSIKFPKQIALVEPRQTQVKTSVVSETKDLSAKNEAKRLTEPELEVATSLSSNLVSGDTSAQISVPEPEIASAQATSKSANLFEGTLVSPSNSAPLENQQKMPHEINEESNTVEFEFADQPLTDTPTDNPVAKVSVDFDFTQVKQKTDIEIARLGWTRDDGREFLQSRYGKRSRLHLKDEELQEFLSYLEQLPTPVT